MKKSIDRILTTHTGSLPRPSELLKLHEEIEGGKAIDMDNFYSVVTRATEKIVKRQLEVGLDIVNDGEMGKVGYATYVMNRLKGFGASGRRPGLGDLYDFPDYFKLFSVHEGAYLTNLKLPACIDTVDWKNFEDLQYEINIFKEITNIQKPYERFLSAASPGVIALYFENKFYDSKRDYVMALAEVMKREYMHIYESGCILQLDCPDLAYGRHTDRFLNQDVNKFLEDVELNIEAINLSISEIPPEQVRLHICWGNYAGPHHKDIDLKDILSIIFKANVQGLCFEAANPRHEHEWHVFEKLKLPSDTVIIPGVIDTCTNYIEHPEVVADRIERFARLVGKENVIAGTDCGFATFAGFITVDPDIAWSKLQSLTDGAKLASERV